MEYQTSWIIKYQIYTCRSEAAVILPISERDDGIHVSNGFHIYPTPPLGQDMTQGQILSGV